MRTIALEEHCLTPALREVLGEQTNPDYPSIAWSEAFEARLLDIGEGRIAEMDAGGIDMQVLSTVQPALEHIDAARAVPVARAFNDAVAAAIGAHPDRFSGFAALPSADPAASASELQRAVGELGLIGAMVNGRTLDRFLDEEFFWPIFESAESLGVPLYLHPMPPPRAVYEHYFAGFGDEVSLALACGAYGWHVEIGLHSLRLMLAGVFDRFPKLVVIAGHMGEVLPFMIDRATRVLGSAVALDPGSSSMELSPIEYFQRNFLITTSGFVTDPPLHCALELLGAERILFAVDHPFGNSELSRRALEQAAISEQDRELIAHGNAERLFGL
jgi:uncharacterized protein